MSSTPRDEALICVCKPRNNLHIGNTGRKRKNKKKTQQNPQNRSSCQPAESTQHLPLQPNRGCRAQGPQVTRARLETTNFQRLAIFRAQILLETILRPPKPGPSPQEGSCREARVQRNPLSRQGASDSSSRPSEGRSAEASNCCRFLFLCLYSGQDI